MPRTVHDDGVRAKVRALWAQTDPKLDVAEIARRMRLTKGALAGLADRMGLPPRNRSEHDRRAGIAAPPLATPRTRSVPTLADLVPLRSLGDKRK
jgi:hypothetical protein